MMRYRNRRVLGRGEDPLGHALLKNPATVEKADALRDIAREAHLVGRDEHGHAFGGNRSRSGVIVIWFMSKS